MLQLHVRVLCYLLLGLPYWIMMYLIHPRYQAVDDINQKVVFPIVTSLVKTAFFRYFKVNIRCDCPLWPDDSMCVLQACSVCECDPNEVPQPW